MRTIRHTVSEQGVSPPVVLDQYNQPFNVGIGIALSSGATLEYSIQHTYDDVFDPGFDPATATWIDNIDIVSGTMNGNASYQYLAPVVAVRLNVTSYTSGDATMTVTQAGIMGN